jgi:hypothetical protein
MDIDSCLSPTERFVRETLGVQFDALVQAMLDQGVPPIFVARGWSDSLDEIYQASLAVVRRFIERVDPDAAAQMRDQLPWHLKDGDLAEGLLEWGTHDPYFAIPETVYEHGRPESRVFRAIPQLWENVDEDGLLEMDGLEATDQAVFVDEYALHYHQFLRRHFNSHINDSLIGVLLVVARRGNRLRLAIDDRRLRPATNYSAYAERDYWHGPPLSDAFLDDPHAVGTTVHGDPHVGDELSGFSRFFVYWRMDDAQYKVVQMEELVTDDANHYGPYRLLRYLHSIRDIATGSFVHCDGAVRAYDELAYETRRAETMPPSTRSTHYRKVFRIDGSIGTDEWSEIVARWFRHNTLALEYLHGIAPT